jgi:hypothetical protein
MQFLSIKIRPNDDAQHSTSASLHKSTNISSSYSSYINGKPTFKTAVATREKKKKPGGDAKTPKKKDDSKAGKQDEDGSDKTSKTGNTAPPITPIPTPVPSLNPITAKPSPFSTRV